MQQQQQQQRILEGNQTNKIKIGLVWVGWKKDEIERERKNTYIPLINLKKIWCGWMEEWEKSNRI